MLNTKCCRGKGSIHSETLGDIRTHAGEIAAKM